MAELAGLSVAANVAQFVVYGIQGAQILCRAYRNTDDFIQEQSEMASLVRIVRTSVTSLDASSGVRIDADLASIRDQAQSLASTLTAKFDKFAKLQEQVERGSHLTRLQIAIQSLWAKGDVERLLKRLMTLRDGISHSLVDMTRYVSHG
jgi:hypothetical protein